MGYSTTSRYTGLHRKEADLLKTKVHQRHYKEFLRLLRQARIDARLTQVEVSKLLGRHQSFLSKCESGERRVDFVELQYLAKIYKKQITYFQVL